LKNEFLRGKVETAGHDQSLSLLFKIITVAIVIAGCWAGSQAFAKSVSYDPAWTGGSAGRLFGRPLYEPWRLFGWMFRYARRTEIHHLLYAAAKVTGLFSFAAAAFYFFVTFVFIKNRGQNIFGTARWAKRKDLEKAGLLGTKGGVILGQLADAKLDAKYDSKFDSVVLKLKRPSRKIVVSGLYNTMLAAPTRSGKGVSCVIPTLLSYPGSVIVLDFKGENFDLTSGFRARFGRVYRWSPLGDAGHRFNPMMEIRPGDDAFSDANLIADILTAPASGGGNASSDHFTTAAKDFLTSLILHCLCSDWPDKSLAGCRSFISQIDPEDPENAKYVYDLMLNAEHTTGEIHRLVCEGAANQRKRPDKEGGSVLSTVNNALAVFADVRIKRNTSDHEFCLEEFEKTAVPVSLYITIPYSDVQRISPLIRMFVLLMSRRFTAGETKATARKFKIPLLFILDEFDKLGKMEELHQNMGIHNGYGIHYFLIFQSVNQLSHLYGKDHSFLAHCRNALFFAPGNETESAELISRICGRESFLKANMSYSGGRGGVGYENRSASQNEQERSLINPDEVMKLPFDSFILLPQNAPPYIGKKNVYYDDAMFVSRLAKAPAFATRGAAVAMSRDTIEKFRQRQWFDGRESADGGKENPRGDAVTDNGAVNAEFIGTETPGAAGIGNVTAPEESGAVLTEEAVTGNGGYEQEDAVTGNGYYEPDYADAGLADDAVTGNGAPEEADIPQYADAGL
jgi:type IV secretion system protein VirD4